MTKDEEQDKRMTDFEARCLAEFGKLHTKADNAEKLGTAANAKLDRLLNAAGLGKLAARTFGEWLVSPDARVFAVKGAFTAALLFASLRVGVSQAEAVAATTAQHVAADTAQTVAATTAAATVKAKEPTTSALDGGTLLP